MKAAPFYPTLKERRDELVDMVCKRLKSSDAPHYRQTGSVELRERSEALVDAFLGSAKGDPAAFVAYIGKLAEERIAEGFVLREIQLALSILEEQAWQVAVECSTISSLVPHLSLVTTTIGRAKDRLAEIFLDHKQRAESRAGQLERRLEALFKGTDGVDLSEDQ